MPRFMEMLLDKYDALLPTERTTLKAIAGALAVFGFVVLLGQCSQARADTDVARVMTGGSPDIVEIIELSGEIDSHTAQSIAEKVEAINNNPKAKAVLLVVNSPGGGAIASASIYEELSKIHVPVVGWCDRMCASGGEYALMAPSIKYIFVRTETVAGSIGVIMHSMRYNRLLEWAHIDPETYRSGILKDAGNPTRAIEGPEKAYLQGIVSDLAESFYAVVGKTRHIKDWDAVKSARIFIGKQAVDVGLADAVGSKDDAVAKAKALSKSKLIFTRDELKKMSKAAEDHSGYYNEAPVKRIDPMDQVDLPWLVETLKEIKDGGAIEFRYELPLKF